MVILNISGSKLKKQEGDRLLNNYRLLMSTYNRIEAENVEGILEMEGIKVKTKAPGKGAEKGCSCVDIYVPYYSVDDARHIIEVEMVRGDF